MVIVKVAPRIRGTIPKSSASLHRSFKSVIILGQCFALLPVSGVSSTNALNLRFEWYSWRVAYASMTVCLGIFNSFMCLFRVVQNNLGFYKLGNLIFCTNTCLVTLLFVRLAQKWPGLMKKWYIMELAMNKYGEPVIFPLKFKVTVGIIALIGLTEHVMITCFLIKRAILCNITGTPTDEVYFKMTIAQIFSYFSYTPWLGFIFKYLNIQGTFTWNFKDIFIMMVSAALANRFRQINNELVSTVKLMTSRENFWKDIREDYNRLCLLTKTIDDELSLLILVSYFDNLYTLCCQLYNIFKPADVFGLAYFSISTCLVIIRIIGISMFGASVYEQSRMSVASVQTVPSFSYNTEVERFTQQLTSDMTGLSGMKFFYITRGLVLSILGTILTYELVLFQFNTNTISDNNYEANETVC